MRQGGGHVVQDLEELLGQFDPVPVGSHERGLPRDFDRGE